ncbi:glycosyltransferase family 2 protein [Glutamicibacter sp. V16R2B1]|uniref:glycosyltransferase family 2 protein n=1 Tax=Glutamicibacter sp. V16R2B1 TaxID=2036207 RepID=UPI0010FDC47B|nr:glycosyltransferase family 2 protein [Glutamicibacter sp. V16R2B1]TLK51617.1 glycosyltransferase family 2 protein [Glutamicibacter sp. V16R2B1]
MTATHTPTGTARVPGLISVIIPAYNQEPFINDALDSLVAQRLGRHRLQVIVVDDHSSDLTPTLVQDYRGRFEDLRLITHPENRGVSAARNTGLAAATGSYVTFLDPDDWFSRDHLASLADGLERLEVDFVRCDQVRVRGTSRSIHRAPQALHNVVLDPREDILPVDAASMIDYPYVFTGMYRHDVLGDTQWFDPALATCEDRPWLWRLYLSSTSYAVVGEASQFYRRNLPGSLTQVFDERQLHFIPAFGQIVQLVSQDREADRFLPKALRQFFAIACHHLDRIGQFPAALAAELRRQLGAALAQLPPRPMAEALEQLDPRRRKLLRTVYTPAPVGVGA